MNYEKLHELIDIYTENYEFINNEDNNELFKWVSVKHFRDVWFREDAESRPFAELFNEARKESSVLIDNSIVHPSSGVVKIAEQKPKEVEFLFRNVLFAEDNGNLALRQEHMDAFLAGMDKLRLELFPRSFKFKQDRHAASCYLSLINPKENYIYRYSDAEAFASYMEFGLDLGSGDDFNLVNYHKMCDIIVEALTDPTHTNLRDKYYSRLTEAHYHDDSFHLMAFDLMYCARTYGFYRGMEQMSKKDRLAAYRLAMAKAKEQQELQEKIEAIMSSLQEIDADLSQYEEISLLNVEVTSIEFGIGRVISQTGSTIKVSFDNKTVSYHINKKYSHRPKFEGDEEIVDAFTEYDALIAKRDKLEKELKRLTK